MITVKTQSIKAACGMAATKEVLYYLVGVQILVRDDGAVHVRATNGTLAFDDLMPEKSAFAPADFTIPLDIAKLIAKSGFMECVIAPGFASDAFKLLSQKKNLRLVEIDLKDFKETEFDFKKVEGGLLWQEKDTRQLDKNELNVVTKIKPTSSQFISMLFGWKIIKHIKSNAIVLVQGTRTVGVGCGKTSRIDSTMMAIKKAGKKAKNSVLVSEAFIPKTDNVMLAAKAGVKAIIQTGGSIVDPEVIKAADKAKIAMVMTGVRHFKH